MYFLWLYYWASCSLDILLWGYTSVIMWYCSLVDLLHEMWDLLFPVKPIFQSNSFPWFVFTALKTAPVSANRYITSLFHRAPVCSLTHFADSCTAATSRPARLPQVARIILFPTCLPTIPVSLKPRLYLRQKHVYKH